MKNRLVPVMMMAGITLLVMAIGVGVKKDRQVRIEKKIEASKPQISETRSGDGKIKVVRSSQTSTDGGTEYVFKIVDGEKELVLFAKTVPAGTTMEAPGNSWSPDNKQLFIKENGVGGRKYFVYKADGSKYGGGEDFLEVASAWEKAKMALTIKEVTGWGGNDLLILTTVKEDGGGGPAFWYVTSSRKFLQLRQL